MYKYISEKGGSWKSQGNIIGEILPNGEKFVRFKPVAASNTGAAMDSLCNFLNNEIQEQNIDPFLSNIYIYDSQPKLKYKLVEITNSNKEDFPEKITAVTNNRRLHILSPKAYLKAYTEGNEDKAYEKLITHELTHQLHLRILNGKDELMGPIWFYEGFAVFAADQFKNYNLESSVIWEVSRHP